ncbi:MAG: metal-sensitive transcriptional regulator [Firmicutes bacterium]|nr:metal-sensitive transcriptional regulator [Bacillota bacterium]
MKKSGDGSAENIETGCTTGERVISEKQQLLQGELLSRLKKIEGQVRGVSKMIQECRKCGDIVIQLAAIKAAVNRVGISVLACHLAEEIEKDLREGKDADQSLAEFIALFKKFS